MLILLLDSADFRNAQMPHTKFERTRCIAAHFEGANLSQSIFYQVNAKGAFFNISDLTNTNFSLTNLQKADFSQTQITISQLESTLSIRDAVLPNRTHANNSNLIKNGYANCNIHLLLAWTLTHGNITVMRTEINFNSCRFVLQSNDVGASMYQKISLTHWDSSFWKYSVTILNARMTNGVLIELNAKSQNGRTIDRKILGNCSTSIK